MTDNENPEIFGTTLTPHEEIERMFRINRKWLKHEALLYTGKWFDYRFISPVKATYLYAHELKKTYQVFYKRYMDAARAPYVSPFKGEDFFADAKPMRVSGIWRGRQIADALCMPYDIYLNFAFDSNLKYWNQAYLPRPNTLYSDLVTDRAQKGWKDLIADRLWYSKLPQYQNRNFQGTREQLAHHDWIFAQTEAKFNPPQRLAELIYRDQVLPAEIVAQRLGQERFDDILEHGKTLPEFSRYN
jgi:hypothetical protein